MSAAEWDHDLDPDDEVVVPTHGGSSRCYHLPGCYNAPDEKRRRTTVAEAAERFRSCQRCINEPETPSGHDKNLVVALRNADPDEALDGDDVEAEDDDAVDRGEGVITDGGVSRSGYLGRVAGDVDAPQSCEVCLARADVGSADDVREATEAVGRRRVCLDHREAASRAAVLEAADLLESADLSAIPEVSAVEVGAVVSRLVDGARLDGGRVL